MSVRRGAGRLLRLAERVDIPAATEEHIEQEISRRSWPPRRTPAGFMFGLCLVRPRSTVELAVALHLGVDAARSAALRAWAAGWLSDDNGLWRAIP